MPCAASKSSKNRLAGRTFPFFTSSSPLPDALPSIGVGRNIEQPLVRFRILHDCGGLAFHGKHHGTLALLELFHEVAGPF
jgi:hypothetical protein